MKLRRRKTLAGGLRHIADCLERIECPRFAATLRAAVHELSEIRWENGVLRRRLGMKARKQI